MANIRVQSGTTTFGGIRNNGFVTLDHPILDVNRAFVRITSNSLGSHGRDAGSTSDETNRFLGCNISIFSNTTLLLLRDPDAQDFDVRVKWELWEDVDPFNEGDGFTVRKTGRMDVSGLASGMDISLSGSGIVDINQCTALVSSYYEEDNDQTWARAKPTIRLIDKATSDPKVEIRRENQSSAGDYVRVQYTVIEWGSNWTVQEGISHVFGATGGVTETASISDVGDWSTAVIFSYMRGAQQALSELFHLAWPGADTTTLNLRVGANVAGGQTYTHVISHPDLVVTRDNSIDGAVVSAGGTDATASMIATPAADDATGAVAYAVCDSGGTALREYPKAHWAYEVSSTGIDWERLRVGESAQFAGELIDFTGLKHTGGFTLILQSILPQVHTILDGIPATYIDDNQPGATPNLMPYCEVQIDWTGEKLVEIGENQRFIHSGELNFVVHEQVRQGTGNVHELSDSIADAFRRTTVNNIRWKDPYEKRVDRDGSSFIIQLRVPWEAHLIQSLQSMTEDVDVSFDDIGDVVRERFNTLVAIPQSLSTVYDNSPTEPDTSDVWVEHMHTVGRTSMDERGHNIQGEGVMVSLLHAPVNSGIGRSIEIADAIADVFRGRTLGGLIFRSPRLRRVGRQEQDWVCSLDCPFTFETKVS